MADTHTLQAHTLQAMAWPDPALCTERDLYMRLHGPCGLSYEARRVSFETAGHLQFDTYFNVFNIGKWASHCDLEHIALQLAGTGRVELTVFFAQPEVSWSRVVSEVITLEEGGAQVDIPLAGRTLGRGVLFFELRALSAGHLTDAAWVTHEAPKRTPDLTLSITTFRREEAVRATAERFDAFAAGSPLKDHLHLIVVDNGQSATLPDSPRITVIGNENLGGAGGFTRGLLAAQERGATHCLFMDDDAATPMQAIERTWTFLAYATDPATAIAGAMISTRHAWALWENGALFDGACRPQHGGLDLRNFGQLLDMEFASTARAPHNFYGGWWYFAFPLDEVAHLPFPFFVRGDDVSFSLVHDFNIVTLPGVVSFQESFTEKDSPLTWYLDLRSHLAHHLSLPSMDIGRARTVKIALWFWARALVPCHYETIAAVNLALKDVLAGPDFFAENADMAERRKTIGALRKDEAWADGIPDAADKIRINPHRPLPRLLMKITLNGHLLPGFKLIANRVTLPAEMRWNTRPVWGAKEITYTNKLTGQSYTVRHSKARALSETLTTLRLAWRLWRGYAGIKRSWQDAYPRLTGTTFWRGKLKMDAEAAPEAAE